MASVIRMPSALAGVTEGAIQTWMVALGQRVDIGDPLAEIETEKAVVEFVAEAEGTLGRLLAEPGANIEVGAPIAVLLEPGEGEDDITAALTAAGVTVAPVNSAAPELSDGEELAAPAPAVASRLDDRLFATPLVRRLGKERGVDLSIVNGSGPNGRITRRDLEREIAAEAEVPKVPAGVEMALVTAPPSAGGDAVRIRHSGMRRTIARRLTESKATVPHFYLVADCRVDALLELRSRVNAAVPVKVSVNDFVLKATALALMDVPEANAIWGEDATTRFGTVDLAVAVSIDGGLVTPVLRSVERQSLTELSLNVTEAAGRARAGRLKQNELEGGSFAVSNLGMHGVTEFSAIINPPQAGILAVGRAVQKPVVADGKLAIGTVMTVTLSADHRVLDGALAAQWLSAFQRRIEEPLSMLV